MRTPHDHVDGGRDGASEATQGAPCARPVGWSRLLDTCGITFAYYYLTGLIVLDNKTMANITRCMLDSADKTNLSRFFSEADWDVEAVNMERVAYLLRETERRRSPARKSVLPIAEG